MKVSYCTSCKGRLWQLEKVLFDNLRRLNQIDAEWVIFDYHCPDQPFDKLMKSGLFKKLYEEEKIKYLRLNIDLAFSMPLAKNVPHYFASGDYLFNLDADNFIGDSFQKLTTLGNEKFLWVREKKDNGTMGRIGVHRDRFYQLRGYDLDLYGAGYEDIDFTNRLRNIGLEAIYEKLVLEPIQNTRNDTLAFVKDKDVVDYYTLNQKKGVERLKGSEVVINPNGMLLFEGMELMSHIVRI